jgi:hypothetical protein
VIMEAAQPVLRSMPIAQLLIQWHVVQCECWLRTNNVK